MDNWTSGFLIDEAFHPWGTLFDAAAPGRVQSGYASVKLPCRSAYGFATVYAEPAAARPDRPVTTVTYELADTGTAPRYLFAELVKRLGPPDEVTRDDSPEAANENTVVLHADWHRDKVEDRPVPLRRADDRRNSAMALGRPLSLLGRAAMPPLHPFLPPGSPPTAAAASAAEGARLRVFSVRYDIYDDDYPSPSPAELALQSPDVLLTPAAIAARLGNDDFRPVEPTPPVRAGTSRPPAPPCCWVVRRHPRCTSTTSRRRAAAASRKSARHPGPFATPTVQPR